MKLKIFYQENGIVKQILIDKNHTTQLPNNIIKIQEIKKFKDYFNTSFSSYNNVINIFKELSIILNTNISLDEALHILVEGNCEPKINDILLTMQNALENGKSISLALEKYRKDIGDLPILFFNLGHNNGNIKDSINALCIILIQNQKAKKQFMEALSYPIILTITLFLSTMLIFNFIVPKFEHIFLQFGSNLPLATKYLLTSKYILDTYYLELIFLFGVILLSLKYYYKKYQAYFDKFIVLNIPILSPLYKNFILYRFFLTLNLLIQSKYKFQIALENVKPLLNNQFMIYKINQAINEIKNGHSISKAFENTKLFNNITIRLLHTAQQTNTMPTILGNITHIYKESLDKNITYFSSAIGPIFIMIISIFILWLIFALMLPLWDLGSVLN